MNPNQDQNPPSLETGNSFAPENQNLAPTVGTPQKNKKTIWIWLIIILLVLILLFLGWLWWTDKDKKDSAANNNTNNTTEQKQEEKTAICAEGLAEYSNPDLALGFCYPSSWGEVTVMLVWKKNQLPSMATLLQPTLANAGLYLLAKSRLLTWGW